MLFFIYAESAVAFYVLRHESDGLLRRMSGPLHSRTLAEQDIANFTSNPHLLPKEAA
jgi:hypothetical protein